MAEETLKEHTPLPWHAWNRGIGYELHRGDASTCNKECVEVNCELRETFKQADAEFIIRAVNSHYELLEACQLQLAALDARPYDFAKMLAAHRALAAAVSKATEQSNLTVLYCADNEHNFQEEEYGLKCSKCPKFQSYDDVAS